jgi:hypothetical protein
MPKSSNSLATIHSKGTGLHQTYHLGSRFGGAGTTSILGSKTMRDGDAAGGSRETGLSVWGMSDGVAITMGLLLAGDGEGNRASGLSPRHM